MTLIDSVRHPSPKTRRRAVWAAPVVVAGVVAATLVATTGSASGAGPTLPARTAAQLIADLGTHAGTPLSGKISETADLGLPDLPGGHSSASLSWQNFVTGTHTARVWSDGPDKQRLALIGELSEADVVHNGNDLWTYTSDTNTVTHTTRTAGSRTDPAHTDPKAHGPVAGEADLTPAQAAQRVLDAITPTTTVTVDATRTVAGRAAYTLTVAPKDSGSTVRKVTLAIDATKYVPLQVQVFGSSSSPALSLGFDEISFATPAASVFTFHTPAGATVSTNPLTGNGDHQGRHHRSTSGGVSEAPTPGTHGGAPTVIGSGWTAVLELPAGSAGSLGGGLLDKATTSGPNGSRVLHTALVNAVILPDGRTFVGAVTTSVLEHVAATH